MAVESRYWYRLEVLGKSTNAWQVRVFKDERSYTTFLPRFWSHSKGRDKSVFQIHIEAEWVRIEGNGAYRECLLVMCDELKERGLLPT
jgi:hypothetical protein